MSQSTDDNKRALWNVFIKKKNTWPTITNTPVVIGFSLFYPNNKPGLVCEENTSSKYKTLSKKSIRPLKSVMSAYCSQVKAMIRTMSCSLLGCHGYTWTAVVRPARRTAVSSWVTALVTIPAVAHSFL